MKTDLPTLGTLTSRPPAKVNLVKRAQPEKQRFSGKDLSELEALARQWLKDNQACCGEPTYRIGRGYHERRSFASLRAAIDTAREWPEASGNFVLTVSCGKHD